MYALCDLPISEINKAKNVVIHMAFLALQIQSNKVYPVARYHILLEINKLAGLYLSCTWKNECAMVGSFRMIVH